LRKGHSRQQGGPSAARGGPGMAAIFGPGGPIILPWTVRGDHFQGGTVHGMTRLQCMLSHTCLVA